MSRIVDDAAWRGLCSVCGLKPDCTPIEVALYIKELQSTNAVLQTENFDLTKRLEVSESMLLEATEKVCPKHGIEAARCGCP